MCVLFFAECWVTMNVGLERYSGRATCTVCNVLHGCWRGQKNEQQNNAPNPKNNAAAGYQGPVKIELLRDAGLLQWEACMGCIFKGRWQVWL